MKDKIIEVLKQHKVFKNTKVGLMDEEIRQMQLVLATELEAFLLKESELSKGAEKLDATTLDDIEKLEEFASRSENMPSEIVDRKFMDWLVKEAPEVCESLYGCIFKYESFNQ